MPTAAWSMPVPAQNRITRSSAFSVVVAFAMVDFSPLYVRFAPIATALVRRNRLTRCAIRVLTHRTKKYCYSITSSAREPIEDLRSGAT
jgi:hypothetical protein